MDELPKNSFFQGANGHLSFVVTLANTRDAVFAMTCIGILCGGTLWAIFNWGGLFGTMFGGILSALAALGLFVFALDRIWVRWAVLSLASFVGLYGLAATNGW